MSADPNKKTPRTFQCRDVLWDAFEQLSRELECSVDYLINESMKQYARQRGHGPHRTPFPATKTPGEAAAPEKVARPQTAEAAAGSRVPPPPPPPGRAAIASSKAAGVSSHRATAPAPPPIPSVPRVPPPLPPPVSGAVTNGAAVPGGSTLSLLYHGERYPITKERFVIGRGKQSSDLTLRDPNVSRQHALIEAQNGVYFMVDMGSTNGVTFNGQRVTRRPIAEGDVFLICDHELLFTYQ